MTTHPKRIDQFLAGYAVGDATSNAALLIRNQLRHLGFDSNIYSEPGHTMAAGRGDCLDRTMYSGGEQDSIIHHFGIGSATTDAFLATPGRKILYYHNITPGHFFRGYDDRLADLLDTSREKTLPRLTAACDDLWAVSAYNARELETLNPKPVSILPLPYDPDVGKVTPNPDVWRRLTAPVTTLLAVGRLAPNKRLDEIIRAFAVYHKEYNPCSRLFLLGSDRSAPRYVTYLKWLAHELCVPNVCFEGFVWPDALAAYYRLAHVYVSASDHEGYGLPLLEAMTYDVPVIAKQSGGTPEALGNSGLRYEQWSAHELAAAIHRLVANTEARRTLLATQRERLYRERQRDLGQELRATVEHTSRI